MLLFCPSCANTLMITPLPSAQCTPSELPHAGQNRFECRTCPYQMLLDRRYYERRNFDRSKVEAAEDVLGGEGSWENVDRSMVNCPVEACESTEAYYKQAQIRSADEPMTTFYRCTICGHDWREG